MPIHQFNAEDPMGQYPPVLAAEPALLELPDTTKKLLIFLQL
jgi:hypothetical protein